MRELYAMYIERGIYDWRQTSALLATIFMAAPGRKSKIDSNKLNPFLLIKHGEKDSFERLPLSSLPDIMPGIKVIDKRPKS